MLDKVLRMFKSSLARKKRKETKELKTQLEKRKYQNLKNKRKRTQKLKRKHHDGK